MHPSICSPNHLAQHHLTGRVAAAGEGCLCGPSWEHQIYEKTISISLPEKHLQTSSSFLSLLSPKHTSALREHPSRRERCWSRMPSNAPQKQGPSSLKVLRLGGFLTFFQSSQLRPPNQCWIPQSAPAISLLPLLLMNAWKGPQNQETNWPLC